ncbi:hypothetical protein [Lysobacter capsici]|uniref:hypothetical protein n=1 Tax=Lysobacter capsici TaxID=435897 RepID=UPI00128C563D|nr:hypothetical protein [Lysobacter capsici]
MPPSLNESNSALISMQFLAFPYGARRRMPRANLRAAACGLPLRRARQSNRSRAAGRHFSFRRGAAVSTVPGASIAALMPTKEKSRGCNSSIAGLQPLNIDIANTNASFFMVNLPVDDEIPRSCASPDLVQRPVARLLFCCGLVAQPANGGDAIALLECSCSCRDRARSTARIAAGFMSRKNKCLPKEARVSYAAN